MNGKVYLVGAGPGAVDLLTLRALRALKRADIVLYDRLVNPEILDFLKPGTERIYVGKDLGADANQRQERIHTLMIGHARRGKVIARLKGGDPFVFGRGSEEMLRLAEAGIEVEVIPGLSSCITAPLTANIPVTHRGLATSFAVFAGRPGQNAAHGVNWRAAAEVDTAVFLMGVERLPAIVEHLIASGCSPQTPIALVEKATRDNQRIFTGTLADIVAKSAEATSPATIVVGEVVGVRESLLALPSSQIENRQVS